MKINIIESAVNEPLKNIKILHIKICKTCIFRKRVVKSDKTSRNTVWIAKLLRSFNKPLNPRISALPDDRPRKMWITKKTKLVQSHIDIIMKYNSVWRVNINVKYATPTDIKQTEL